jgi:hypothetical protein
MQIPSFLHRIILSSVACLVLPFSSTLFHKWHGFRGKLLNIKVVFRFYLQHSSETFPILRRTERDMVKNVYWSSCKVPLFVSEFNDTWIFSIEFRKNPQISNLMKTRPVGAELFHADGRTDRHNEANSRFT